MRLALLSTAKIGLARDDAFAIPALLAAGFQPESVPWDRVRGDWDALLVRSTWDYTEREDEFRAWLDRLEASGARLFNPAPLLRWNLDKRYLLELQAHGVPVIPTLYLPRHAAVDLHEALISSGWTRFVV